MWKKFCHDRRLQILIVALVGLVINFWTGSRYPSLDTKSMMAGSVPLADGLSFDATVDHQMGATLWQEIWTTYINWLHTNQQGMIFGLTFALIIMTIIPIIRDELDVFLSRRISATFSGALLGAPLGVCVNCAAPIGYGMYKQGARLEAALATMISSPTMNVVVLSMAFTLFPPYIVLIKILASLLVILAVIPWLVHRFPDEAITKEPLDAEKKTLIDTVATNDIYIEKNLFKAIQWLASVLLKQAWVLAKNVIPIMLLAGFIGSVAVVIVPWDQITSLLPHDFSLLGILAMFALSAFGIILPVPIAFDVVLASALSNAGIPIEYIAILLFVLGSFSVYSFMVILRAKARKVAISLALSMIVVGVLAGFASKIVHELYYAQVQAPIFDQLSQDSRIINQPTEMGETLPGELFDTQTSTPLKNADRITQLSSHNQRLMPTGPQRQPQDSQAPELQWHNISRDGRVSALVLNNKSHSKKPITQIPTKALGLDHHFRPIIYNLLEPFAAANSVSSGDLNNDGWADLIFGTVSGVHVYLNNGGNFVYHSSLKGNSQLSPMIGASAIVDLNNDGWQDIIFSEYNSGLWVSMSNKGQLQAPRKMPGSHKRFAKALAFQDIDHDGLLEIATGNVDSQVARRPSQEQSKNILYKVHQNKLFPIASPEPVYSTTLSILWSDIDGNGVSDILFGNDFDEPDFYYEVSDKLKFTPFSPDRIKQATRWTMSFDTADLNNDLDMELYQVQITRNPSSPPARVEQGNSVVAKFCEKFDGPYCQTAKALDQTRFAQIIKDPSLCDAVKAEYRLDCVAIVLYRQLRTSIGSSKSKEQLLNEAAPLKAKYPELYENFTDILKVDSYTKEQSDKIFAKYLPQDNITNHLLFKESDGSMVDKADTWGVDIVGWSWNARFADLDGDEWQDLYVVNGSTTSALETTNTLMKNNAGKGFINVTRSAGLVDFAPTLSYTYVDFDNDGDLDIVNFGQVGKVAVYRNDMNQNHNIQFQLKDTKGNKNGIGSRITIHYGEDGERHQIREIKMSGGFMSFDAKLAHFGLGQYKQVSQVEVTWPDGQKESFDGLFKAGHRYRIIR